MAVVGFIPGRRAAAEPSASDLPPPVEDTDITPVRVGWAAAPQPTLAELGAEQRSPATIPATTTAAYLAFAAPADAMVLEVLFDGEGSGGGNLLGGFTRRADVDADGRPWQAWSSNALQNPQILGMGTRRLIIRFAAPADASVPTLEEIRFACRIDDMGPEQDGRLVQMLAMAKARADRQAPGAPAAVRKEVLLMAISHRYDGINDYAANWWQRSGAASMLKPWIVRRGGVIR